MSRELRPDRRLVNNNFEGYKLDANNLNSLVKPLVTKVYNVKRDPNKFTYNYIKHQLMHNHLFYNQWDDSVYFIDENLNITLVSKEGKVSFNNIVQFYVFRWPIVRRIGFKRKNVTKGCPVFSLGTGNVQR